MADDATLPAASSSSQAPCHIGRALFPAAGQGVPQSNAGIKHADKQLRRP